MTFVAWHLVLGLAGKSVLAAVTATLLGVVLCLGTRRKGAMLSRSVELSGALPVFGMVAGSAELGPLGSVLTTGLLAGALLGVRLARVLEVEVRHVLGTAELEAGRVLGLRAIDVARDYYVPRLLPHVWFSLAITPAVVICLETVFALFAPASAPPRSYGALLVVSHRAAPLFVLIGAVATALLTYRVSRPERALSGQFGPERRGVAGGRARTT